MTTFVLAHGGWHGGWCWKCVTDRLRAAGHEVYAPTFTGLGEREHVWRSEVGLETHITDLGNVLIYEDLHNVVLVGYSYAGMMITAVADRLPDRVSHLVYLDAWVPERGQSIADIWGWDVMGQLEEAAAAQGDSERVRAVVELFGIEDSADLEWATPKFSPQPLAPVKTPLDYRTPLEERRRFTRTYIRAVHGPDPFGATAARLKDNPAWRVVEIDTGHDVMLTRPEELTAILLETADGRDGTSPEQRGEQTVTS